MTPKEYSTELINKFFDETYDGSFNTDTAKQCSIITLNEISKFSCYMMPEVKESMMDYLDEVKQEIEKL
jgi:hypothetical protein